MTTTDNIRCQGGNCPSKQQCNRYTDRSNKHAPYAAFWARRDAGATACDQFFSSLPSTFDAKPFRGVEA